jgi:hypothetical protein
MKGLVCSILQSDHQDIHDLITYQTHKKSRLLAMNVISALHEGSLDTHRH